MNKTCHVSEHEIINDEQFNDMRDLLEDDFADLIQTYITDSQARVEKLRHAHINNDNTSGFEIAHTLKGASASLGATLLMKLSGQFQEACREHNIKDQAPLIERLSLAVQDVEREINRRLGQ